MNAKSVLLLIGAYLLYQHFQQSQMSPAPGQPGFVGPVQPSDFVNPILETGLNWTPGMY